MKKSSSIAVVTLIICALASGCGKKAGQGVLETEYSETPSVTDACTETEKNTYAEKITVEQNSCEIVSTSEENITKDSEAQAETVPGTEAPVSPPTEAPTSPPTEAPVSPPTEAPVSPPTEAPVSPPTEAPTAPPTEAETSSKPAPIYVSNWDFTIQAETDGQAVQQDLITEGRKLYEQNRPAIEAVLEETNYLRARAGVAPLVLDEQLCIAACSRAAEIAYNNCFQHTRPDGSSCFTLLAGMGISYGHAGENIAAGQINAFEAVFGGDSEYCPGWIDSERHYNNMINPDFHKLGVGVIRLDSFTYRTVWVQTFTD